MAAATALVAAVPTVCHGQSTRFQGLGFLPDTNNGFAAGVNADGAVVVGNSYPRIAQVGPLGAAQHRTEFEREFKLRDGEAAQVANEGLALRFERVTADGRCPVGNLCISGPGDAVLLVTVQQPPHAPAALELHTHSNPAGQYLRYRIRLVRLEPQPIGEQQVPLPQYWATFTVSR